MSSNAADTGRDTVLRERVTETLGEALPAAHARRATVTEADPETGTVVLSFGCGCSGSTLSPVAKAALQTRLTDDVAGLETLEFASGCGCGGHGGGRGHGTGASRDRSVDEQPEAPF